MMEPAPLDSDVLASDWFCVRCGYNLRGLSRTGRCPECNTPIPRSLRTRYLAGRSREWVRDVRDGALILAACYAVEILRDALVEVPSWIHLPYGVFRGLLSNGTHLTLYAIECVGIWLLARREPLSVDHRSLRAALWIRRLYVVGFIASIIYRLVLVPYFLRDVYRAWATGELLLLIVVEVLLYNYLAGLAQRIPDLSLARRFSTLKWLGPLATIVGSLIPSVLLYFHIWRMPPTRFAPHGTAVYIGHAPAMVLCADLFRLVVFVWAVSVIWSFASALKAVLAAQSAAADSINP